MRLHRVGGEANDGCQDLIGRLLPVDGLGVGVVRLDEILDRIDQCSERGMTTSLDLALRQQGKPALDLIESGWMGGGKMQVVGGMFEKPPLHWCAFVGAKVVEPQMNFHVGGGGTD